MNLKIVAPVILIASVGNVFAALNLSTINAKVDVSFTGFEAPPTWASASPTSGQLDSNIWSLNSESSITGTAATFGVDYNNGQGISVGGVNTNGVYAFDVGGGTIALGIQPTGGFWTPGMLTMRLQNNTGSSLSAINVGWAVWVFNDQGRSNNFGFYTSSDNVSYTNAGSEFEVVSPLEADASPAWVRSDRSISLSGLNVATDDFYYIRWGSGDVSGSGNRDEFALSHISVTGGPLTTVPEPTVTLISGLGALLLFRRRR